jgi:hypothetical protein
MSQTIVDLRDQEKYLRTKNHSRTDRGILTAAAPNEERECQKWPDRQEAAVLSETRDHGLPIPADGCQ